MKRYKIVNGLNVRYSLAHSPVFGSGHDVMCINMRCVSALSISLCEWKATLGGPRLRPGVKMFAGVPETSRYTTLAHPFG